MRVMQSVCYARQARVSVFGSSLDTQQPVSLVRMCRLLACLDLYREAVCTCVTAS